MKTRNHIALSTALCLSVSALALQPALAAEDVTKTDTAPATTAGSEVGTEARTTGTGTTEVDPVRDGDVDVNVVDSDATERGALAADSREDARETVNEAVRVVGQMQRDEDLSGLMARAKGIFIVPDYGKGAFLVGGAGGDGLMLTHRDGTWSDPVFYDIGALSVGAEAGVSGGSIAMLLMTDAAVESFRQDNNFSFNANADLTVVDYSANAQGSVGKGDVVMWADTEGLFAGVGISASDIVYDEEETRAFYGDAVTPQDLLNGRANVQATGTAELKNALPS